MLNSLFLELNTLPALLQMALVIVCMCVLGLASMYVYLVLSRVYISFEQSRYQRWHGIISQLFAELVATDFECTLDEITQHHAKRFKEMLPFRNAYIKRLVEQELVRYHAQFTGKTAEVLRQLYITLRLDKLAYKRLKSSHWEVQVMCIKCLAQLNIREAAPKFLAFTDDEIGNLRMEAQAAFLKLSNEQPFRFLDRAKEHILDWHQLVLIDVITKSKSIQIPSFSQWLHSENYTVVLLCLKLIRYYQQFDALPALSKLLYHPNAKVRLLAIDLLGQFEAHSSEQELVTYYPSANANEKEAIIQALGRIASGKQLNFLVEQTKDNPYPLVFNSLKAIQAHGAAGQKIIEDLHALAIPQQQSIIKHLLDHRLSH